MIKKKKKGNKRERRAISQAARSIFAPRDRQRLANVKPIGWSLAWPIAIGQSAITAIGFDLIGEIMQIGEND